MTQFLFIELFIFSCLFLFNRLILAEFGAFVVSSVRSCCTLTLLIIPDLIFMSLIASFQYSVVKDESRIHTEHKYKRNLRLSLHTQ